MNDVVFEKLRGSVKSGLGYDGLMQFLRNAARLSSSVSAFVAFHCRTRVEVLASYNLPFELADGWDESDELSRLFQIGFFSANVLEHLGAAAKGTPLEPWRQIISVPVRLGISEGFITLNCVGRNSSPVEPPLLSAIESIAESCTMHLRLLGELVTARTTYAAETTPRLHVQERPEAFDVFRAQSGDITSHFLLKTLVVRRRMHTRGSVSFASARTWRAGIKEWQIVALKALKQSPPAALVDQIAQELLTVAIDLGGEGSFSHVTFVPCGHSGAGCLASRIAQRAATLANLHWSHTFESLPMSGSSHPKTNAQRPRMKLQSVEPSRFLLVDDVATSGAHLTEATRVLRATGSSVLPVAWIAA